MACYLRSLNFFALFFLSFGFANAQSVTGPRPLPDTTALRLAELNMIEIHHRFMGEESRLFNGYEHVGFLPLTNGQPYFQEETPQIGSIVYEDAWYPNVLLMYDLIRDELITITPGNDRIVLYGRKVREFFLLGHHFITTPKGYYDLLVTGKMNLEVKRIKTIQERTEAQTIIRNVEHNEHYYIVQAGVSYPIGNLRSLLALMKDKKKDVLQDLKGKKIRYRKDHEGALVEAVTYYNQSLPQ
jgi:hypothetical protein